MKSSMQSIKIILLSLTLLLSLSVFSAAEQKENETEAIKAAKNFLQLVDGGQYHMMFSRNTVGSNWHIATAYHYR